MDKKVWIYFKNKLANNGSVKVWEKFSSDPNPLITLFPAVLKINTRFIFSVDGLKTRKTELSQRSVCPITWRLFQKKFHGFLLVTARLRSHAKEEIVPAKVFKFHAPYFANVMTENMLTLGLYQNWRNSKENLFDLILLF